jgi:ATP-dependent Clp protease ATP-binding subunit ClpC
VGAGRTEGGSLDAANILKPALARGEITVIGATTNDEYRKHFETDSALERRFQPILIDEPSEDDCVQLLTAVRGVYEEHHGVEVAIDALRACVEMGIRYIPDRRLPDKALDLLDESCADASLSGRTVVDREIVAGVVSDRTGVPVRKLTDSERDRVSDIENTLKQRVIGQDEAVSVVGNAVRLMRSGLRSPNRPRGVFLFAGVSGVGKTELAKTLADFLFPEGDALIRLDMSEYADRFTATRLLGAPPGYSGHGEEGQLSGPLRRKPYSVVLLDEFEKAHEDVQSVFLSIFDEGTVTDSEGRTINAREALFVLTTNAGAESQGRSRMGFSAGAADSRAQMLEAIRPHFRPELIDRTDEVVPFKALEADSLAEIVGHHLGELTQRAAQSGVELSWSEEVPAWIVTKRNTRNEGARSALRAIETTVAEALSRLLISLGEDADRRFRMTVVDDAIAFEPVREQRNVPAYPG